MSGEELIIFLSHQDDGWKIVRTSERRTWETDETDREEARGVLDGGTEQGSTKTGGRRERERERERERGRECLEGALIRMDSGEIFWRPSKNPGGGVGL